MKAKMLLAAFMAATLGIIAFLFFQPEDRQGGQLLAAADASVGKRHDAPDFILNDLSGRPVALNEYRGKAVLLGFSTTW